MMEKYPAEVVDYIVQLVLDKKSGKRHTHKFDAFIK